MDKMFFRLFTSELQMGGQWKTKMYENVTEVRSYDNGQGQVTYKCLDGITREISDAKIRAIIPQHIENQSRYEILIQQEIELERLTDEDPDNDSLVEDLMDVRQALAEWS